MLDMVDVDLHVCDLCGFYCLGLKPQDYSKSLSYKRVKQYLNGVV